MQVLGTYVKPHHVKDMVLMNADGCLASPQQDKLYPENQDNKPKVAGTQYLGQTDFALKCLG